MVIYMRFVLLGYEGGIDGFIGATLFQPIIGGLMTILTIGVCLLIGFPIRVSKRINTWWTKRTWIPILGVLLGLSLIVLALIPSMTQIIETTIEKEIVPKEIPNLGFAATGWLLTAFSLLHVFPPYRFRTWTEDISAKYTGGGGENGRQHSS